MTTNSIQFILTIVLIKYVSTEGKNGDHNAACHDARTRPFLSTSIWNTPVGTGAVFHDSGIFRSPHPLPQNFFADNEYFLVTTDNDPWTPWYHQGCWNKPCGEAHCNITGKLVGNIRFPYNVTVRAFGNNSVAALLQPDNHSIINTHPVYRCTPGLNVRRV